MQGEAAFVKYRGRLRHYPGKIWRDRGDGSYDIAYDDGEKELAVKKALIRHRAPPPAKATIGVGSNPAVHRMHVRKAATVGALMARIEAEYGVPVTAQRLWSCVLRENGTTRPDTCLTLPKAANLENRLHRMAHVGGEVSHGESADDLARAGGQPALARRYPAAAFTAIMAQTMESLALGQAIPRLELKLYLETLGHRPIPSEQLYYSNVRCPDAIVTSVSAELLEAAAVANGGGTDGPMPTDDERGRAQDDDGGGDGDGGVTAAPPPPPPALVLNSAAASELAFDEETRLLFIKFYEPPPVLLGSDGGAGSGGADKGGRLRLVGRVLAHRATLISVLLPAMRRLAALPPDAPIVVFEEVAPQMVDEVQLGRSLTDNEIITGDVLCFQLLLPTLLNAYTSLDARSLAIVSGFLDDRTKRHATAAAADASAALPDFSVGP